MVRTNPSRRRTADIAMCLVHCLGFAPCVLAQDTTAAIKTVGRNMSLSDAMAIEERLKEMPNDAISRAQLIAFYNISKEAPRDRARLGSQVHTIWIIENAPRSAIAADNLVHRSSIRDERTRELADALWDKHVLVHCDDLDILRNAALYWGVERIDKSSACIQQARALDPTNVEWSLLLARLWKARLSHLEPKQRSSDNVDCGMGLMIGAFEHAIEMATGDDKCAHEIELMRALVNVRDFIRARAMAERLLAQLEAVGSTECHAQVVHWSNICLGMDSLERNDEEMAELFLQSAGETVGSSTLRSFGPDLVLARRLLERGRIAGVRAYLLKCRNFWESGRMQVDQWVADIDGGVPPRLLRGAGEDK